jgi:mono/diheme cytochrome c family protein
MPGPEFEDGAGKGSHEQVDVARMHAPIYREKLEPEDGYEALPTPWLLCMLALALVCGWYMGNYSGGFSSRVLDGDTLQVAAADTVPVKAAPLDPKVLGARVYNNCMACHQADGKGLPGQFPPLAQSEWVNGSPSVLARILLHGLHEPIEVAGKTYDGVMPGWQRLADEQIAAVLTYIRGSFGNSAAAIDPACIAEAREATGQRTLPWTQGELRALPQTP